MFLHYLNIITRHLLRNKWLSFLKLLSLTLGLCSFLIVMVINHSERTWDHDWEEAENIYVLKSEFGIGSSQHFSDVLASNKLQNESITGVVGRAVHPSNSEKSVNESGNTYSMGITDEVFFEVFKPRVITGSLTDFAKTPDAIVIAQDLSENLFGKDSAIGKTISIPANEASPEDNIESNSSFKLFKVVAVIDNPSPRSSITKSSYIKKFPYKIDSSRQFLNTQIFVKLNRNITREQYQKHLDNMFDSHYQPTGAQNDLPKHKPKMLSINDINLDKDLHPGKNKTLWILYLIAAAVLLVSLVNYINMVISSQLQRQKEIALYRLFGSSYNSLFFLFFIESLVFLTAASAVTLAITQPVLPWLFKLLSIPSDFSVKHFGQLWSYLVSLLTIMSILLALFPLLSIKNTMPARILSANQYTERKDTRILRYAFLCFQLFAAACFSIAAGIMSLHIHHALTRDLGYTYKNVHQFHFQGFVSVDQKTALIQELKKNPNILGASRMASGISSNNQITQVSAIDVPREKAIGLHTIYIADFDVFNTYAIKIVAGSLPVDSLKTSVYSSGDIVICEQSLSALGFANAESAVNQKINLYFSDTGTPIQTRIAAVTSQISSGGLLSAPVNCIFWNAITPEAPIPFSIRYKEDHLEDTRKFIKETSTKIVGTEPIDWSLQGEIEESIKQEKLVNQFLYAFLAIILIICLLGIYGVSSLDAQKRKKEIALRKLHGANRLDIIQLLSKRFLLFILLAHAVAMPVSLYFMSDLLKEFPNQINLPAWSFALTLVSIVVVFTLTSAISTIHTFKIVSARPAETLKVE
jgi:putative ABC transport system permease protein